MVPLPYPQTVDFVGMQSRDLNLENAEILVVDDTPINLHLLSRILSKLGANLRKVSCGEDALQVIQQRVPDIILLDICMPGMDGFEVCRHLKASSLTQDVPVIFITALTELSDKLKAFEVGGIDYITKPFHNQEVLARVRSHLMIQQLQKQLQIQNQYLQTEIQERQQTQAALQAANAKLDKVNKKLEFLATHDELTQLANRRHFNDYLHRTWRQMLREKQPLTLILCDIDYFKRYNDTYGHAAGDTCLSRVSTALHQAIQRPFDLAARYGGEEFALILPATNAIGGMHVAERIQQLVKALDIPHVASGASQTVSLSIGVTAAVPDPSGAPEHLLGTVDKALYHAKENGRDRITFRVLEHKLFMA